MLGQIKLYAKCGGGENRTLTRIRKTWGRAAILKRDEAGVICSFVVNRRRPGLTSKLNNFKNFHSVLYS